MRATDVAFIIKPWKRNLGFGSLGLAITLFFVVYQLLTDPTAAPPHRLNDSLIVLLFILCPPSLLSIPIIDAEVGTSGFYFLWSVIGLLNAALYAAIGAMIIGRRKKSD